MLLKLRGIDKILTMNIKEAEELAKELIAKHIPEYRLVWVESLYSFGKCFQSHQVIELSRPLTLSNSLDHVKDTILHEIAHALAPTTSFHDTKWQEIAKSIGCNGKRCYSPEVIRPTKWISYCRKCSKTRAVARRMKRRYCGECYKLTHRIAKNTKLLYKANPNYNGGR